MKKFILVGQGIAGSTLAFHLIREGHQLTVFDSGFEKSSTAAAAGIINPVSFKRLVPSWNSKELIEHAQRFYSAMEAELQASFYHPIEIARIFPDVASANLWDEKSVSPDLQSFLTDQEDEIVKSQWITPFGHGIVKGAAWINTISLLASTRQWLRARGILREEVFHHNELIFEEHHVCYRELKVDYVISAVGTAFKSCQDFAYLPIHSNKGQVLEVKQPDLKLKRVVNYGNFFLPIGADHYRIGSTYEFNHPNPDPTEEVKEEFLRLLKEHWDGEVEFVHQIAGYRPTTSDRRPIIGPSPTQPRLIIFNGLGSKGTMLSPFCIHHLMKYLEHGIAIPSVISIQRMNKHFKN